MGHVIWDWNGTLFDDLPIVVEAVNACLLSRGEPPIDNVTYRVRFVRPLNLFYEGLLGHPVDDAMLAALDDIFQDAYWDGFESADLRTDARAAVMRVAGRGATQSVASMLWHDMLVPTVKGFGLDEYMLALDGNRGTAGETKQEHMVGHVDRLRRMYPGLQHSSMTVIGDITDDARAARAAGVQCVLFDGGSQTRRALEAEGFPVAESLVEAVSYALDGDR